LVYALFWLTGGLAALFFLFHAGQAVRQKTQLVNATDAAALSAGHLQARALNAAAFYNRALLANEVLIAQMVGISSWSGYAQTHAMNVPVVHPECLDPQASGAGTGALFKYGPGYALMCYLTAQGGGASIASGLTPLPSLTAYWAALAERHKVAIQQAQHQLFAPDAWQHTRAQLLRAVALANLPQHPGLQVEAIEDTASHQHWQGFVHTRHGEAREPLANLARQALAQDDFSSERRWTGRALLPSPECFPALEWDRYNEVRRRGSTELVSLDEWRAIDTESFHAWRLHKGKNVLPTCRPEETPTGWGGQTARSPAVTSSEANHRFGGSATDNPVAHGMASTQSWSFYSGMPSYASLSEAALADPDSRLPLTVRIALPQPALPLLQADANSRLNAYTPRWANGEMVALSSVEVYFQRPFDHALNLWGQPLGLPQEKPSLFNPFWHARLVDNPGLRQAQQQRQGAITP
jgi:hypothetical protein